MEVLLGAIFELLKITIQSGVYGFILLFIYKIVLKQKFNVKLWLFTSLGILIGMILYLNTHWGAHGLGDSRRIPLRFDKEIEQINGTSVFINFTDNSSIPIEDFAIRGDKVFGETGIDAVESYPTYFVWNIKNDKLKYYNTISELRSSEKLYNFKFSPFYIHYYNFWGGWKFWLLP